MSDSSGRWGSLYYAHHALMALEDEGHEGGLTDFTGVHPSFFCSCF